MQFKNKSDDARELTFDGIVPLTVAAGDVLDVPADQVDGLVLQCGPDGAWEPGDDEAKQAVAAALAALEAPAAPTPPAPSALKADWVDFATAKGDTAASTKTKQQLVDEHGQPTTEGNA